MSRPYATKAENMNEHGAESARVSVDVVSGSFGRVVRLWHDNVLVDTYCRWNGDPWPAWLDEHLSAIGPRHIDGSERP